MHLSWQDAFEILYWLKLQNATKLQYSAWYIQLSVQAESVEASGNEYSGIVTSSRGGKKVDKKTDQFKQTHGVWKDEDNRKKCNSELNETVTM